MSTTSYTLGEIAELIGGVVQGDSTVPVRGIAPLELAKAGDISFLDNKKYRKFLASTQASAVILSPEEAASSSIPALICKQPYVGYAKAANLFNHKFAYQQGIHSSAVIGAGCTIADDVSIAAHCVIEDNVTIGSGTYIGPGCVVGQGSCLGEHCHLWANVTIYHGVNIANRAIIHSGVVIGSDGFGIANDEGKWLKVPQLGGVSIEDDVEIGANTAIDRGAMGDTLIGEGVKLDNQIQVGHNVEIGAYTAIAGCTGISGSTKIGRHCRISGMVGFTGHFEIADGTVISGMSMVSKSITQPGIYSSGTALEPHHQWRKNAVRFRQLDDMAKRITELEHQLKSLNGAEHNDE